MNAAANDANEETVLVAEDDECLRSLLRAVLRQNGYNVLEAADGLEALEVGTGHLGRIELLLTDIVMPNMNGQQLAERLCSAHPETRVLFMSGYVASGVLDDGATLLRKPFSLATLLRAVREALAVQAARSARSDVA